MASIAAACKHAQSPKWFRAAEAAQTTWQEEAGWRFAAICCANATTTVECIIRSHQERADGQRWNCYDRRGASRDDASLEDRLQRLHWDAGQRQEDGEEVRHQDNRAADQGNAPHEHFHWTSQKAPSPATRCQDKAQEVMAQALRNLDDHPGEAVRSVRRAAERLSRAHTDIQEGDTHFQKDYAKTQCSGCRSSYPGAGHRGGRSSRTPSSGFRGGRTPVQCEQDAQEVPQVVSSQRHDRAAVRRRRFSDGSSGIKEAAFLRSWIWKWLFLSFGSGSSSPCEIVHHVPIFHGGSSVDNFADAYRQPLGTYAACQVGTDFMSCPSIADDHVPPLHSVL